MPLFFQQDINHTTRLAIWHITEPESFFLEKAFLQRTIAHPHKRLQHLAGRYLLQYLFPSFPYKEMLVADTRKPYLPNEQFHFSISHCGNYAAVIVSTDKRVGIDIEVFTDKIEKISHKFLHEEELAAMNGNEDKFKKQAIAWSAKEAMFKWWGLGEVDFSEVLRLNEFEMQDEGNIYAAFRKEAVDIPLTIRYKVFKDLTLAWLATDADIFKMTD
jgi:phosphopantetheinyl transferase